MTRLRALAGAALLAAAAAFAVPAVAAGASALPSGRTTYRSLADYEAGLTAIATAHPGMARRIVLPGRSIEGRPLDGVEIGDGVGRPDDGRPVFLIVGLTHGREWPSGEVAMEFAEDLVRHPDEPRIARILAGERVVVVPVVNPDGFQASFSGADPLRRRNCRADAGDDPNAPCAARHGVDLNRNFGAFWGGLGAGVSPADDTYRGTGPWSEPESQAVHAFAASLPVTTVVSLHNVSALVLRPPGSSAFGIAPDEARLKALGDAMGAATGYPSRYGYELYEVTGALEDWDYLAQGAFSYTIELGPVGSTTFDGPYQSHVVDQYLGSAAAGTAGRGMREALLLAAGEAMDPRDHAEIAGRAPAGAVLRLHKDFTTQTSAVCADAACHVRGSVMDLPDALDLTLTVGRSGRFTWQQGPSTRPYVGASGGREAWTLSCSVGGAVVASRPLVLGRGQLAAVEPCAPGGRVVVVGNPAVHGRPLVAVSVGRLGASRRDVVLRVRCAAGCVVAGTADVGGRRGGAVAGRRLGPGAGVRIVRMALDARARRALRAGAHALVRASAVDATGARASVRRVVAA